MPTYAFAVHEYDPAKPWLMAGKRRLTVEADDGVDFQRWADATWPRERFRVELDPRQVGHEQSE